MSEFKDIRFKCPRCDKHLVIDAKGAGFVVTCPDCQLQMIVPNESDTPPQESIKPTPPPEVASSSSAPQEEPEYQEAGDTQVPERSVTALLNKVFETVPGADELSPEAQYVLQTIRTLHRSDTKLKSLISAEKKYGDNYRRRYLQEMVDLVLHFIRSCLEDHKITATEVEALMELRTLLDIHEGDLYRERKDTIRALLERQIDWMESDFRITHTEELYLVDLQRIFDLSYDQLLELSQPHVAEILDNLCLQLSIADTPDVRIQVDQLMRDFCMIHYRPFEVVKEDADEVAGRMIPQSVKDAVWRRDGGKCTNCGSQKALEFDHIIPFSLGGSNTYRNIQLLCQDCNRNKAAHIG